MIETVYVEEEIIDHSVTKRVLKSFPRAVVIEISRYQDCLLYTSDAADE